MIIKRLQLQRFKKFKELDLTFSEGLNVVRGPNEQGKSTLVAAFIAGLFYDPMKKNKAIKDNMSWGEERLYEILMEFQAQENDFVLQKDFEQKHLLLKNVSRGEHFETFKDVERILADVSGLSSPSLFETTACVRQDKIAELSSGKKELDKALQDVVTSGSDNVSAVDVLKELQKIVVSQKKGLDRPAVRPGPIKKIMDEIEVKQAEFGELRQSLEQSKNQKKQQTVLSDAKEKLKIELQQKSKLYEENKGLFDVGQKETVLNERFDVVQKALEELEVILKEHEELTEKVRSFGFADVNLKEIEQEIFSLEMEKKNLQNKPEIEGEKKGGLNPIVYGGVAVFVLGFLGLVQVYLYGLFIVGFIVAIFGFFAGKKSASKEVVEERTVEQVNADISAVLSGFSVQSLEAFREKKEQYENAASLLSQKEAQLAILEKDSKKEKLEEEKKQLAKELAVLEAQKDKYSSQKMVSAEAFHKLEQDVIRLEKNLQDIQIQLTRAEALVQVSKDSVERSVSLEEDLVYLQEQLENEKRRLAVYEQAFMAILEAKNAVGETSKDVLSRDMKKYIPFITDGKYEQVEIDNDLVFYVENEVGDMMRPEEGLSRGTIDQIYLAARFSLLKMMSEQKQPPIILDDPMVTFDAERTRRAMDLIKEFSKEFQVFLFTYSDAYDAWANTVVEL